MHFLAKQMLVVVWPAGQTANNNAATTTLQGKARGCYCSCKLLMLGVEVPETCSATQNFK
jgi:hypothetical protein